VDVAKSAKINKMDVALVVMPMAGFDRPSLAAGILQAELLKSGVSCTTLYENVNFAAEIGFDKYSLIDSLSPRDLAGEWLFAEAAFGRSLPLDQKYLADIMGGHEPWHRADSATKVQIDAIRLIQDARIKVEDFIASASARVLDTQPLIVGLTSTFQQNLACIAISKRIKASRPSTIIVIGGANMEGDMGARFLETFDCIDAVCAGPGEGCFCDLTLSVKQGKPLVSFGSIIVRDRKGSAGNVQSVTPGRYTPDYSDYFRIITSYSRAGMVGGQAIKIPVEGSRGCWWGMKSHCSFCGLNGQDVKFRTRDEKLLIAEMRLLLASFGHISRFFFMCDNIVPMRYFKSGGFFECIASELPGIGIFCETKGNLTGDYVRRARQAGVTHWQPGIESLADPVLRAMGKGISAAQNIRLLRTCFEEGVVPLWNYLIGFPDEKQADYDHQVELIKSLYHLPPPSKGVPTSVRLDRFSPLFRTGLRDVPDSIQPFPAARLIYRSLSPEAVFDLSYYFVDTSRRPVHEKPYWERLKEEISQWAFQQHYLVNAFIDNGSEIVLVKGDVRHPLRRVALTGDERELFLELREPRSSVVNERRPALDFLIHNKVVLAIGGQYINVSVRHTDEALFNKAQRTAVWSAIVGPSIKRYSGSALRSNSSSGASPH